MVKEVNKQEFYGIEFNPIEQYEENLPEIIVYQESDNCMIKKLQISRYNDFLKYEIKKREKLLSTYRIYEWIFLLLEIFFFVFELAITTAGLAIPSIILQTSVISMVSTTLSASIRKIFQYFLKNSLMYKDLLILTKSKLLFFEERYLAAIEDNNMSHQEYMSLIEEFKKFEGLRSKIISNKK